MYDLRISGGVASSTANVARLMREVKGFLFGLLSGKGCSTFLLGVECRRAGTRMRKYFYRQNHVRAVEGAAAVLVIMVAVVIVPVAPCRDCSSRCVLPMLICLRVVLVGFDDSNGSSLVGQDVTTSFLSIILRWRNHSMFCRFGTPDFGSLASGIPRLALALFIILLGSVCIVKWSAGQKKVGGWTYLSACDFPVARQHSGP